MSPRERFVRRGGWIFGWVPGVSFRTVAQVCPDCRDLAPRSDGKCACPPEYAEPILHAAALERVHNRAVRRNG